MKIKNDKLDKVFSRLVRERNCWICERCGKQYERGSQGLHCSHNFSRRAVGLRWDPENACALCYPCHSWFGGNPILGAAWLRQHMGDERVEKLAVKYHKTVKLTKADKLEIFENLKGSLRAMEEERNENGRGGRIEFDSPYNA